MKIAILLILLLPSIISATKPCPPHPCRNIKGVIQEKECRDAAEWVAIGKISDIKKEQLNIMGLEKISFVFSPIKWEKGIVQNISRIGFGRHITCSNPIESVKDFSGNFRVYGVSKNGHNLYLDFVLVE